MEIFVSNPKNKYSEVIYLSNLENNNKILKKFSSINGALEVKIFASKGSLMEENFLKVSWILSKSNKEKISKYLLSVFFKTISIELNLGIVF